MEEKVRTDFFSSIGLNINDLVRLNLFLFSIGILISFFISFIPLSKTELELCWRLLNESAVVILFLLCAVYFKFKLKTFSSIGLKQRYLKSNIMFFSSVVFLLFFLKYCLQLIIEYTSSLESVYFFSDSAFIKTFVIFNTVLFFPVLEELFFRGLLYPPLRKNLHFSIAIILNALIFSFWHVFGGESNFLFAFVTGLYFAYAYEKSLSLLPGMGAHIVVNSYGIASDILIEFGLNPYSSRVTIVFILISLCLFLSFFILSKVFEKKEAVQILKKTM